MSEYLLHLLLTINKAYATVASINVTMRVLPHRFMRRHTEKHTYTRTPTHI